MFHALNLVSGSLWHFSQPQPRQWGTWTSSAWGLDPALSPHPVQALPTPRGAQFDQNSARAGSASTPSRLAPLLLSTQHGNASQAGLQGQAPTATSHPTAGNSRVLPHFRTQDFTQISFAVCYSRERGLSVGDDSIAEVTSALLALPQPRDKHSLLFTPQTPVNIYCIALNALVKTFAHIRCLPKSKLI